MTKLEQAARQALVFIESLTGLHIEVKEEQDEIVTALREALDHSGEANEMVAESVVKKSLTGGEQWSPDDMAYRPSGLSMEQAEQEPVGIVWDASAPVVMDSSSPKNKNKEVAELRKQVAALKAVVDAWNNVEQEPVACIIHTEEGDYVDWSSKGYCFYIGETPLYTRPARTKDLTDEEIFQFQKEIQYADVDPITFARAVIAADREKNK